MLPPLSLRMEGSVIEIFALQNTKWWKMFRNQRILSMWSNPIFYHIVFHINLSLQKEVMHCVSPANCILVVKYNCLQTLSPKKSCGCKNTLLKHCTVSIYYFPTDEDDEGPTVKEKLLALCLRGIDIFCVWDCCWLWIKFRDIVALLVFDPFVELFITLCIVVNTLFMALDHYDMNKDMEKALKSGNYVSCSDSCWDCLTLHIANACHFMKCLCHYLTEC